MHHLAHLFNFAVFIAGFAHNLASVLLSARISIIHTPAYTLH